MGWGVIVLGCNDSLNLVDHFVSPPRDREQRDIRYSRGDKKRDREERKTGMKV